VNTEQPLLPRIAAGEVEAVSECLDRYGGLVWSLARRYCTDVQLVEDSVHNIFFQLWEVADRFDQDVANETTFVAMIARRRLIDGHRKQKRFCSVADLDFDKMEIEIADPTERIEIQEEAALAEAALNQLPMNQQLVIRMNVLDGMSHSCISDLTGMKLGTVKTHIRRGLIRVRESMFYEAMAEDENLDSVSQYYDTVEDGAPTGVG
jgi:RNA polymerase sigma-70 factor (ECF subfamily)